MALSQHIYHKQDTFSWQVYPEMKTKQNKTLQREASSNGFITEEMEGRFKFKGS